MPTDEIKRAAPLKLFFDLVFVFAITQIVSLTVHDLTWTGMVHGGLVLALLWWAWSHYTWAANGVDLEPRMMRIGYLSAMVVIFIMAHAVPFAFEGQGHWLAYGYLLIRVLALYLGFTGSTDAVEMMRSLRTWLPWAMLGPIAVIIGAYMGDAQQWWWLAGWILELASSAVAGTSEWELNVEHFAECHGPIMIIAFGEAIVVIGSTVSTEPPSWDLAGVLAVGILGAMALWWAYCDRLEELWEWALGRATLAELGKQARDVYSILHYPMLAGVVLYHPYPRYGRDQAVNHVAPIQHRGVNDGTEQYDHDISNDGARLHGNTTRRCGSTCREQHAGHHATGGTGDHSTCLGVAPNHRPTDRRPSTDRSQPRSSRHPRVHPDRPGPGAGVGGASTSRHETESPTRLLNRERGRDQCVPPLPLSTFTRERHAPCRFGQFWEDTACWERLDM